VLHRLIARFASRTIERVNRLWQTYLSTLNDVLSAVVEAAMLGLREVRGRSGDDSETGPFCSSEGYFDVRVIRTALLGRAEDTVDPGTIGWF
jgi:hypothetical protein